MKTKNPKNLQASNALFFLFIIIISNLHPSNGEIEETNRLLSFKSTINDPQHFLSNWNNNNYSLNTVCSWHGITCSNTSFVVTGINLSGKNITGELSPSIFELEFLQTINLSGNQISGTIPMNVFNCSTMKYLNLSNNNFTGSIPDGYISNLETLDFSNNFLFGVIPYHIGAFLSLKYLDFGGNVLAGKIPISIANMSNLESFTLASNLLVGEIPRELCQLKRLKFVYFGYNNFSGKIPEEIGLLSSVNHLNLVYNKLSGEIPASIGNLTELKYLFLYQNKLTGSIPDSVYDLVNLVSLDLSDNVLTGEVSEQVIKLQNLEILHLFSNQFSREIPQGVASLFKLQVLQLWSNNFTGGIPKGLGKNCNLTVLDLSTNSLTGEIPNSLCYSGTLSKLILFSNSLHGEIPKRLSYCKSLSRVRLQNNRLSGELAPMFLKLPLVYFLDMSGNNISGKIGDWRWDMPSLQMLKLAQNNFTGHLPELFGSEKLESLDLSENHFTGAIPKNFGNLCELMQLKLSSNEISGNIPELIASYRKLVSIDLSHNQLTGKIPKSLSGMPVLGLLDLSDNELSGEIPRYLGQVSSLVEINISHNHLHGRLPFTGAFLVINSTSVLDNDGLCGGDKISGLPSCKDGKSRVWWLSVTSVVIAFGVMVLITLYVLILRKVSFFQLKRFENEDGVYEIQLYDSKASKDITLDAIFSSANQGDFDSGRKNCVLSKNFSMQITPVNFWNEMAEFAKVIRHRNIVKVIGTCRSEKSGYVIYEFIEGKSSSDIVQNLTWERRRKVAMGIANALRFLHCYCSPSVLVGDMSPENVIIDANDEPHLRLCLPGLACSDIECFVSSAYVAPETREKKGLSKNSDIYGFGLVLIELLTGKSPVDSKFGTEHGNIVKWAKYCYSECHVDTWIDPMIREGMSLNQNELVETMKLALQCTSINPSARPCASDVLKTLKSNTRRSYCAIKP